MEAIFCVLHVFSCNLFVKTDLTVMVLFSDDWSHVDIMMDGDDVMCRV